MMTRQQAIEWAADSAYTNEVYHVTSVENVDDLLANGFDLDRCGSGVGSIFGNAIYVTQDAGETLGYYLSSDDVVAVAGRIRVTNPLVVEAWQGMHEEVLHNEIVDLTGIYADNITDILAESEYDAIIIEQDGFDRAVGGSQIILQSADQIALYGMDAELEAEVMARVWEAA